MLGEGFSVVASAGSLSPRVNNRTLSVLGISVMFVCSAVAVASLGQLGSGAGWHETLCVIMSSPMPAVSPLPHTCPGPRKNSSWRCTRTSLGGKPILLCLPHTSDRSCHTHPNVDSRKPPLCRGRGQHTSHTHLSYTTFLQS